MDPQYAYQSAPMNMPTIYMAGGGLPAAAQQVQSMGRHGDSTLVHMSPDEVRGLNAIARSQGTSLSINPHTGLPEAFKLGRFLKAAAPMLIGAALAPMTAGTSLAFLGTPMGAGLAVGGIEALRTKSLSRGLTAGLGAAGGAGLAGSLAGSAAATSAGAAPGSTAFQAAQSNLGPAAEGMSAAQVARTAPALQQAQIMGQGVQGLGSAAGRQGFMTAAGGMKGLATTAGMAAAPFMATQGDYKPPEGKEAIRPFDFDYGKQNVTYRTGMPGESTAEQRYFVPTFTPRGVFKPGEEPTTQPTGILNPQTQAVNPSGFMLAAGGEVSNPMDEMSQDGGYAPGGRVRKEIKREGEEPYDFADFRAKNAMRAAVQENFDIGGLTALARGGRPR